MSSDEGKALDMRTLLKQLKKLEAKLEAAQEEARRDREAAQEEARRVQEASAAKLEALEAENKLLKASRPSESSPKGSHGYVLSVSNASKDKPARDLFYSGKLLRDPVKGGFVGSAVYREFVLAARDVNKTEEVQNDRVEKLELAKALAKSLKVTSNNQDKRSMFSLTHPDDELQQSYTLALILAKLNSNHNIDIGHQFHVIDKLPAGTNVLASQQQGTSLVPSSNKGQGKSWSSGPTTKEVDLNFDIDVFVSCSHPDGTKIPVAAIEYKPNNGKYGERVAQCDMYGYNLLTRTNRACIGIDIAGGLDVSSWHICAWGYFYSHDKPSNNPYEKSLLFEGSGWDGLIGIVRGLEASGEAVIKDPSAAELKDRLGPVVCRDGAFAYKVYDNPNYRSPNLDVVQFMLDRNATASIVRNCTILKMRYFESNWKADISVEIFSKLATKLKTLHDKYGPHGDIRLANLLSCGHIVDFDYVKKETYPDNLNSNLPDGKRHQEVINAITGSKNVVSYLTIKTEHDWHSFSAVMDLFEPTDDKYYNEWESAKEEFKKGDDLHSFSFSAAMAQSATDDQAENVNWSVKMKDSRIKIMGSGPTPEKK